MMSLWMHACSFKPLCKDTQFVHFALPSVHLQYMEEASSTNVLTSNVTASVTMQSFSSIWLDLERWIEAPNSV